ncbi:uncharacterized protein [Rutidosis leptorrhynchoides]|uniref:uncharacterized protein n=1 Tax=Rutidosis leptorrhynchoides TaxID=125765 RepID=UPI003A9A2A50
MAIPENQQNTINDPLHLASSDHPGMTLTSTPFNGTNYLGWSRTIKMALGAKLKLGFIDGTIEKPAITDEDYPKDLSKVTQGNLNVASYYNKLKRCWDELQSLNGIPTCSCGRMRECTCGVIDKFLAIESRSKLIQFLMRLNDEYEFVRSQILSMDPLPSLNKAYYIVQQVEKQKQVTQNDPTPTAFFANTKPYNNYKKVNKDNKDAMKCTFCNMEGHTADGCFERIVYPDWYTVDGYCHFLSYMVYFSGPFN